MRDREREREREGKAERAKVIIPRNLRAQLRDCSPRLSKIERGQLPAGETKAIPVA